MSTIGKIVELADQLRENAFPLALKVAWIAELDAHIALEVMKLDVSELEQFQYDPESDLDTQPLVRFPHDNMYHYWLCAKIDAENGEYNRYQNSMQLYNNAFLAFRTWFSRVYDVFGRDAAEHGYYLSAYALAVNRGFTGTLDAWLESLIGPPGPEGPMGPIGQLPDVTEADNGSVLRVVGGAWAVDQTLPLQVTALAEELDSANDAMAAMADDLGSVNDAMTAMTGRVTLLTKRVSALEAKDQYVTEAEYAALEEAGAVDPNVSYFIYK